MGQAVLTALYMDYRICVSSYLIFTESLISHKTLFSNNETVWLNSLPMITQLRSGFKPKHPGSRILTHRAALPGGVCWALSKVQER